MFSSHLCVWTLRLHRLSWSESHHPLDSLLHILVWTNSGKHSGLEHFNIWKYRRSCHILSTCAWFFQAMIVYIVTWQIFNFTLLKRKSFFILLKNFSKTKLPHVIIFRFKTDIYLIKYVFILEVIIFAEQDGDNDISWYPVNHIIISHLCCVTISICCSLLHDQIQNPETQSLREMSCQDVHWWS